MRLRTFGGLSLEGSDFTRPKPLLLLAYLALEGPKSRRYLADLFFMEAKDPLNSLSRALSYLRKEVPGSAEADHKKAWATLSCDAEELLSSADKRQFAECTELYEGPFVETLDLELGEELEEWVYGTREYLAGRVREALLQSAGQEATGGNFVAAASLAEEAYTLTGAPELEPEHFGRIYTLLSAGANPRAAEVRDEAQGYGIELGGSSQEAKAQLQPAASVGTAIPHNLPPPKTSFVGREQELIVIAEQLVGPDCRLLTLHGMGGIGKSRLAVQAAYEQLKQGSFKDGVFFVPLDALSSADLIPSSIAEALGLELQGQEDTLTQVKRSIGEKRVLLVLDNYEHLMEGALLPSELLQACPKLKLLVTSREVLRLEEEWVKALGGLDYPEEKYLQIKEAQNYGAVALFLHRAKRTKLDFSLTPENWVDIVKICKLLEGSPLAIELSSTWSKLLPPSGIAKEIHNNLDILAASTRNINDRHQSTRVAFGHSWALLTQQEQNALRRLAIFRGGFVHRAASEITGATLPILDLLVNKSLLQISPSGRFDCHTLIFKYISEKLTSNQKESSDLRKRHSEYFFSIIESLGPTGNQISFQTIDEEITNIYAATEWALEEEQIEKLKILGELVIYFDGRAKYEEGERFFGSLTEYFENLEREQLLAMFLVKRAWFQFRLGRYDQAKSLAQKVLWIDCSHTVTDVLTVMNASHILSVVERNLGNYEDAKIHAKKAFDLAEKEEHYPLMTLYLRDLALAEESLGNLSDALGKHRQALTLTQEHGSRYGLVGCLGNLGVVNLKMRKVFEAQRYIREGLHLAEEGGFKNLIPELLECQAQIFLAQNFNENAFRVCQEAIQYMEVQNNPSLKSSLLMVLGRIELTMGKLKDAKSHFQDSLRISRSLMLIPQSLRIIAYYAVLLKKQNHHSLACCFWSAVLENKSIEANLGEQVATFLADTNCEKHHGEKTTLLLEEIMDTILGMQPIPRHLRA